MVSFFGIKFGDKKKKAANAQAKQPHEWKRIDQNALGEGQFFGNNVTNTTVVNGSIRSVSRANTAMSMRSPYPHETHNLAASSMFDLSHGSHSRNGSLSTVNGSNLRPHASEAGLRTKFGATNGSSLSLAVPGPGFGSRPTTPGGKPKQWVNPLDVHFARSSPTVPPAQRSPLAQIGPQSSAVRLEEDGDKDAVFGKDADEMVEAMMASAKKKEEEEKAEKDKKTEMEKQKETARLEMERLERQKSAETKPPQPQAEEQAQAAKPQQPQERQHHHQQRQRQNNPQQRPVNGPSGLGPGAGPGPVFRGNIDQRPGSRGGNRSNESGGPHGPPRPFPSHHNAAAHQGPPQHAPPTHSLPHPPQNGGSRNYLQGGPSQDSGARNPRANVPGPNGPGIIGPASRSPGPAPQTQTQTQNGRSYSPAPNSPGFRGQIPNEYRSQSPSPANGGPGPGSRHGPGAVRPRGPGGGPILQVSSSLNGTRTRGTNGPEPLPLRRSETAPVGGSMDNGPVEQFARPIIQNVAAKRDTFQMNTPRRHSLSMKIEELEKTLLRQRGEGQEPDTKRVSSGSSDYSASIASAVSSMSDDDEPILPTTTGTGAGTGIQPAPLAPLAPLRTITLSPVPAASTPSPTESSRWHPNAPRGLRGPPPRRPTLDEYGVVPGRKVSNPRPSQAPAPAPTPAPVRSASGTSSNPSNPRPSLAGSDENINVLQKVASSASRSNTPQLRQANWVRDESPVVPVAEAPIIPLGGFKFEFENTKNAAPPTPDSSSWPLPSSPIQEEPSAGAGATPPSATLNRSKAPPPLNFNFSPDAYSREQGPWTPPLRSSSKKMVVVDEQERPSTAGGFSSLAPAPSFNRSRTPVEGVDIGSTTAATLGAGIGLARGLSIRDQTSKWDRNAHPTRPPPMETLGERPNTPVDAFGTGFI